MGDAYIGPGAEKLSYQAVLYTSTCSGRFCAELPDMNMVACGECKSDVCATLQGLLEEEVETMLEDCEVLPQPKFDQLERAHLSSDARNAHLATFTVVVPSTISKDLLSSVSDCSVIQLGPRLRELDFVAVVLLMGPNTYGGYFPDLSGAFTSGSSKEEACKRLHQLLEFYVGGLVKDGSEIPTPKFSDVADLQMTQGELERWPVVCTHNCTVEIPA